MAQQISRYLMSAMDQLRYEPTPKRIRGFVGDEAVVDSSQVRLVLEPRRVVPAYAVPEHDVHAELTASAGPDPEVPDSRVVPPFVPFAVHTGPGRSLDVVVRSGRGTHVLERAAFAPDDEDMAGYVVLDFEAFDRWMEEEQEQVGHPRDPFHRVDVRRSSRHVRVELDGQVLADTHRPVLVAETNLPARWYLPPDDVRTDLLRPTDTHTICAYKGVASYWSLDSGDSQEKDLAWSYPDPLEDAVALGGYLAFFDERVDVSVDEAQGERPVTEWSKGATGGAS